MATTMTLSDGTTTLDLMSPTDYRIEYGSIASPGAPANLVWSGNRQQQGQTPAFRRWANKEIRLVLRVEGTSQDDLLNNYNAAERMLYNATRYWTSEGREGAVVKLTVQLNGATNATEYQVYQGTIDPGNWATTVTTTPFKLFCPVTLTCAPFGRETADVTFGGSNLYNSGVSFNVTNARGAIETPVKIAVTNLNVMVGNPRLIIATRTRGNTSNFQHVMEAGVTTTAAYRAETPAWTGNATTVATTTSVAALGTYVRLTSTATASGEQAVYRWTIDNNVIDNLGAARVFLRSRAWSGAGPSPTTSPWALRFGETPVGLTSADKETGVHTLVTTTAWAMNDLGVVTFPTMALPSGTKPNALVLELRMSSDNTSGWVRDIDYMMIVPIDEYAIMADFSVTATSIQRATLDGMGYPQAVYPNNTSGERVPNAPLVNMYGTFPMMQPGNSRWFFYFNNATNDVVDDYINVSGTYRPQYGFMRGTT